MPATRYHLHTTYVNSTIYLISACTLSQDYIVRQNITYNMASISSICFTLDCNPKSPSFTKLDTVNKSLNNN